MSQEISKAPQQKPRSHPAHPGVLQAIGKTPLVRLERLFCDPRRRVYAKLDFLNPGGSIKDRPALAIIQQALESGEIGPGTRVVESSSGNMGVGLAQVCRYYDIPLVVVVDPKTSPQNIRVLEAYGARVEMIHGEGLSSGELLQARLDRVHELRGEPGDTFWPNQYCNRANPRAHYETTVRELIDELGGEIDFLFVATSTCGTIRGCGEYVRDMGHSTRLVAVDAVGSLIFDNRAAERNIPGLGAGITPAHCDPSVIHQVVHVDDGDCVAGCRDLLRDEAILAGGSSGGVIIAARRLYEALPVDSTAVVILCDRGERYLDTVYCDAWAAAHSGAEREDRSSLP